MTKRKGLILAGGAGTRLAPATHVVSKQLLPIYDKPMVYYPLTTLMLAGIRDILVISTPMDLPRYQALFGTGEQWGLHLSYAEQPNPGGLAQAYTIGADFVRGHPSTLILGDNLFYGSDLSQLLQRADERTHSTVFSYHVSDPERYGIVSFDTEGRAQTLEEKPKHPKSSFAVTGLYFYDAHAVEYIKDLTPSPRGELEITDLNKIYLAREELSVEIMGRGYAWLDTGTHNSLLEASQFIQTIETRQGLKIGCPEEVAYTQGWIDAAQLEKQIYTLGSSTYGAYLKQLLKNPPATRKAS